MDQKSPTKNKTAGASSKGPRSAHIIDLRANKPEARPQPRALSPQPPKKKPAPKAATKKTARPEPQPELDTDGNIDILASPSSQRRFWPSFFRFLALLVVLGLIIATGLYLYLNYYA